MWNSEDNCVELVLSSHLYSGSRMEFSPSGGGKGPTEPSEQLYGTRITITQSKADFDMLKQNKKH